MPHLEPGARAALETDIAALDGVLHASLDPPAGALWIVRDPSFDRGPVELAIRNRLATLGHDPAALNIRVSVPLPSGPRRRVRFMDVERVEDNGRVTITVRLEWDDHIHSGSADGEKGDAIELRTAARAAIDAIEGITGTALAVRLIGVKVLHAFDSDLMVASLLLHQSGSSRLVGAVLVRDDILAAASLAVLSALNRTLGNFLHTSD